MSKSLKETILTPSLAAIRSEIIKLEKSTDPQAYFKLATLYLEIDEEKAIYYYQQAAEQGHHQAQYVLGYCYLNGKVVVKDNHLALKWIAASAMRGNPDAQYQLAYFYAAGCVVQKNQKEALGLFCRAVSQGSVEALPIFTGCFIMFAAAYYYTVKGGLGTFLVNWNWREDLYDFQIHSYGVNIDKLENFKNALFWLGSITKNERGIITALTYKEINKILVSANSPIRKTGMLITICRTLLDGLQNNRFGKMAPFVISYFITAGMISLLTRQLNTAGVEIIQVLMACELPVSYLKVDEKGIEFKGVVSGSEDCENFPADGKDAHPESEERKFYRLIRSNQIKIDLEEIETAINQQLDKIPYTYLLGSFIPYLIGIADNLNSTAVTVRFSVNPTLFNNYKMVYSCFYAIKKPFLKAKDRILNQERKELLLENIKPVLPTKFGKIVFAYMNPADHINLDALPSARFFDEGNPSLKMW
jgi:hypothetical protein